jgi:hypothetical protein
VKRTPLRRHRKPAKTTDELALMLNWVLRVHEASGERSQLSGRPAEVAHHVVYQQKLRRHAKEIDVDPLMLLWDPRNGMSLTLREHERHHSGVRPILLSELPDDVWRFAADYRLESYLERRYPGEDCGCRRHAPCELHTISPKGWRP